MADPQLWLVYGLLGALAGLLAGMFGIGGGLVLVPAMNLLFARQGVNPAFVMHLALGTSLGSIVFTSVSSLLAHHRRGAVLWPTVRLLVPGILMGGFAGAWLADAIPNDSLRRFFGAFVILVCLYIVLGVRPSGQRGLPGRAGHGLAGTVIGVIAALTGIGGGAVTNPFLLWRGVPIRNSVATSAACTLPVAVASTVGYVWAGWGTASLPAGSTGFVYWPAALGIVVGSVLLAPLGARIAHTIPVERLRKAFAALLLLVALRMLLL